LRKRILAFTDGSIKAATNAGRLLQIRSRSSKPTLRENLGLPRPDNRFFDKRGF
jgi:hypothetical protein